MPTPAPGDLLREPYHPPTNLGRLTMEIMHYNAQHARLLTLPRDAFVSVCLAWYGRKIAMLELLRAAVAAGEPYEDVYERAWELAEFEDGEKMVGEVGAEIARLEGMAGVGEGGGVREGEKNWEGWQLEEMEEMDEMDEDEDDYTDGDEPEPWKGW